MNFYNTTSTNNNYALKSPENTSTGSGKNPLKWQDDPAGFMVSIIKSQHSMYKKEIANWKSARASAFNLDTPNRKLWIELANEMMQTDAIIINETSKRRDRVLNKTFKITEYATKKENNDKTDLFNKSWFYDWMGYAMDYLFYGFSLVYVKRLLDGRITEVDIVDRRHVIPEREGYLPDLSGTKIQKYTEPPFSDYCTPIGKPGWLGLLDAAAPLFILRKHSWANWDQFEEMFGIPIRIAKTASQDPKVRSAINSWLRDLGSAAHAVFPQDTELEVKESSQPDAFKVFNEKRKAANEELALLFNSQAETSNNSGSRAKAETVVASTQDETTLSDMRFIYFLVNDKLMPLLANIGYPINPEMDVFQWDNPENLKEKLEVFKGVSEMGFELDPVQVEEVFNVKIIGKKEVINPLAPLVPDPAQEGQQPKK